MILLYKFCYNSYKVNNKYRLIQIIYNSKIFRRIQMNLIIYKITKINKINKKMIK